MTVSASTGSHAFLSTLAGGQPAAGDTGQHYRRRHLHGRRVCAGLRPRRPRPGAVARCHLIHHLIITVRTYRYHFRRRLSSVPSELGRAQSGLPKAPQLGRHHADPFEVKSGIAAARARRVWAAATECGNIVPTAYVRHNRWWSVERKGEPGQVQNMKGSRKKME